MRARKFGNGSGANTGGKSSFIAVFQGTEHLKRIQTVLFSGPLFSAKKGVTCWLSIKPGSGRRPI